MNRLATPLRTQQVEAVKNAVIAANRPVRRSSSEGGKELGYDD